MPRLTFCWVCTCPDAFLPRTVDDPTTQLYINKTSILWKHEDLSGFALAAGGSAGAKAHALRALLLLAQTGVARYLVSETLDTLFQ